MNTKIKWLVPLLICCLGFTPIFEIVVPQPWPKPYYNFKKNRLTSDKILLGRHLFYDPILSANGTISCASCHSPYNAFTHADHALSHGIYDSIGTRNSPALMNLAWQPYFMWDGSINNLDMQALAPLSHPAEMGEDLGNVLEKLKNSAKYKDLFWKAWNDSIPNTKSFLNSLSQFMLSLISNQSKYDSVSRGEVKFTSQEQRGYQIFKNHCNSCHTEPLFSNYAFVSNGLKPDPNLHDLGRVKVSLNPSDSFKFKVPTLRNIEYSYPYMHDGRFASISEVIKFYSSHSTIGKSGRPLQLNSEQKVDLQVFLLTLSDKHFIFNPNYTYPIQSNYLK